MNRWIDSLRALRKSGEPAMLVTVMDVRGSAPRECGAKMLVTASELIGTIGGGQLEYQCARIACERLAEVHDGAAATFVQRFPLGSNCGQCCGGVVEVLFEKVAGAVWIPDLLVFYDERVPVVLATAFAADGQAQKFLATAAGCRAYSARSADLQAAVTGVAHRMLAGQSRGAERLRLKEPQHFSLLLEPVMSSNFNLALFGAGHVGSAVVATMAGLDGNIRWIDSRRDIFPDKVPANVTCLESESPQQEVAAMPANAFYLVMTHSHPLDFDICSQILRRGDFAYCGLIGSISKRRRFEKLMRKQGMPEAILDRLTCPIGIMGIESKKPEAIAIAVAAELLQKRAASTALHGKPPANLHVLRQTIR
jgi:xanthine dehydrogenase accessory factor